MTAHHPLSGRITPIGSLLRTTTEQGGAVLGRQLDDQPLKIDPAAGVAVSVTVAPAGKSAEQPLPEVQSMPGGSLTIVPDPKPASKTVKVREAALEYWCTG
jgi:hypothetical protein